MRNYEVTFIVDPVLSGDEIKSTAQTYVDMLKEGGCSITHVDDMGLRQLAYPINKRSSGIYTCVEFEVINGEIIDRLELALRRDERIMRFLTVALDKFGVKYNKDKREGKIGKSARTKAKEEKDAAKSEATKKVNEGEPVKMARKPVVEKEVEAEKVIPSVVAPEALEPVAPKAEKAVEKSEEE